VVEDDDDVAHNTPARHREEPDPKSSIPRVEEQVRTHQAQGLRQPCGPLLQCDAGGLENQVVDGERNEETQHVGPLSAAQEVSHGFVLRTSHEST
jgi:hypothetical protein